ncbi:CIC11C00000000011 [Sungouiella intermedia]|uniref:CIC11C00000000011 n=1 Tax=Sungouiella intermedia TaxID=45354 RepID=A0A1L0BPX7_9ASCO|nr:CIC11C00000000011 [[Candida] intermedia]
MNSEEGLLAGAYDHHTYDSISIKEEASTDVKSETAFIGRSSGPLVVTFFLQYLMSVISIYAAGKLGPKELAAASLALCSFNITGLAVYQGMATCLDSFCSQAYGAGKLELVGVYFQRCSLMVLALTAFPLAPLWWWSGSILKHLVPDEELAIMSQTYLRIMLAGSPGLLLFETGKRFLQAQHIFNAGTYVLAILVPINFITNWLLVWHPTYGLGFIGAPIASSIGFWLISFLMLMYVWLIDGRKCWGGLDLHKAMTNWMPMLKLALPGVVMVEAEYLAFEVLTILAASFGTSALAAQSIAANIGSLAFQLPFAVAVAITTRIGHFVGMRDIKAAAIVTRVSFLFGSAIAVFNFLFIFFGRNFLTSMFTDDKEVLSIGLKVLMLVALNQLSDGFNVLEAGVLRGQGRQKIGSFLNLFSYYVIALPVGYVLAFVFDLELLGLWLGLISGVFFLASSEFVCILRSNWPRIVTESADRHDH